MGELLRKGVAEQSADELWKRVNGKIEEGEPVPTVRIIKKPINMIFRSCAVNFYTRRSIMLDKERGGM